MTPADRSHAISSARTLLEGCAMQYGQAIDTNRLDAWATMAHAIIDLLASKGGDAPAREETGG